PVEGSLRPELLHDPDQRVRDQHAPEQRVLDRSDDEDRDEHRAEKPVEQGEDVRLDDGGDRPARRRRDVVDRAARDPLADLRLRQPIECDRPPIRIHGLPTPSAAHVALPPTLPRATLPLSPSAPGPIVRKLYKQEERVVWSPPRPRGGRHHATVSRNPLRRSP